MQRQGKKPIRLRSTRVWRTYTGGRLIDDVNGWVSEGENFPEEWISSCVEARNVGREGITEGLSLTSEGIYLRDMVEEDPEGMLGEVHYKKYGSNLGVLAKIIDPDERLTIQCHPTRDMAREYLGSQYGKTEAWYILGSGEVRDEKPCIYMGFKEGVTREGFTELFYRQDLEGMLGSLNRLEVEAGEVYLIRGGMPHAIGKNCFLMEIQEPTDYTIRVEKTTPAGLHIPDEMCHQGVGFERMFDFFDFTTYTPEEVRKVSMIEGRTIRRENEGREDLLIGNEETDCFTMKRIRLEGRYTLEDEGVFVIGKVIDGEGTIGGVTYKKWEEFFIPAERDEVIIEGRGEIILCYPPSYNKMKG